MVDSRTDAVFEVALLIGVLLSGMTKQEEGGGFKYTTVLYLGGCCNSQLTPPWFQERLGRGVVGLL